MLRKRNPTRTDQNLEDRRLFRQSPRDGTARFVPKVGTFGRANLTGVYMAVRVWAGVAALAIAPVFAAIGGRPELWLLTLGPIPTIVDGLRRRNVPTRSLMTPLLIDCTGVGALITVAGLSPVAVAYSLTVMAIAAVLATRSQLGVLFLYIGAWMTTGLVVSSIYDLPGRWNPTAAMAFTVFHVLLAMVALGMLVTMVMQRLHQVEGERSRLIGGFAHDMKNALTGAVGMAELLANDLDGLDRDEIVEYATMVVNEGREAVAMTEDLLTIERAEAGRLDVSTLTIDLVAEATRVIAATGRGAEITVEEPETAHQQVCTGDPVRIRQILRNLISNADRYGGEHLRISVGATDATAFVRVADSGTSIPEEDRERIFDAYQRARHQEQHAESVGLGLTISRHLARLMGGDLTYRHTDGWSVFELTLPRTVSNPSQEEFGELFLTRVEQIWLDGEGILRSRVLPGAHITLEDAQAGVGGYAHVANGAKRPLLIYAENTEYLAPQARSHYTKSEAAAECVSAVAFLANASPTARTIANYLARFAGPPIPTRVFDDETKALTWLDQHRSDAVQPSVGPMGTSNLPRHANPNRRPVRRESTEGYRARRSRERHHGVPHRRQPVTTSERGITRSRPRRRGSTRGVLSSGA